jgi:PmbA protein
MYIPCKGVDVSSELLLSELLERARGLGASAADAFYVEHMSLSSGVRMGKPEQVERAESKSIGLRVFLGQRVAAVSGSDLRSASLAKLAAQALHMAKASTEDPFAGLAPPESLSRTPPNLDLEDGVEPSPEWLEEQCRAAEEAALAVQGVTNSEGAEASYGRTRIALATSHGFQQSYGTSRFSLSVAALAGSGTQMERDYDYTQAHHRSDLATADAVGKSAGERAVRRLFPRKPPTQRLSVVFDPRVSRALLGNLGGALNGASVARGISFLKDEMGKQLFAPGITVVDDPHRLRGLSSRPFDAEGVATARRALVENGVLVSWLLDVRSANQLHLHTTGHASRGASSPPTPSPSNLYLEAGSVSPAELMRDIEEGFYVTETFGSGGNIVTGDYSAGASGFRIEKGEIAYPVSEVTVAGRLQEMFQRLVPANDLEFRHGTNAPTIRIDGLTVAGA